MICYRDMTFCNAPCAQQDCHHKLTNKVWDEARDWWGDNGAPVAICDFSTSCIDFEDTGE